MEHINPSRRAPFGSNPTVGEAGRATQQRILAAATDAFADLGYARTSVEAITDRAGCSRPTFYQYFSGKEDLHRRLAGRLGAELAELISRLEPVTPDAGGRDVLCRWLVGLAGIYDRYRAVADNFSASIRTDEQMVSGAAHLMNEYRRALVRALEPTRTTTVDIEVLAGAANVMAYGACISREHIGRVSADRLASALADTLHRTFFGPLPAVNMAPRRASTTPKTRRAANEATLGEENDGHRRGLDTRRRLLDAAICAYGTLGFDAVRVDDIATEAGTSHGTFYRYFRDKEAIFAEHADATALELVALLQQLPTASGTDATWAEGYYSFYEHHGAVIGCFRDATNAGAPGAIRARHAAAAAISSVLDQRTFGDPDADLVTFFSLIENVPAAAYGYAAMSVEDATAATAVILNRGIFGRSAPP